MLTELSHWQCFPITPLVGNAFPPPPLVGKAFSPKPSITPKEEACFRFKVCPTLLSKCSQPMSLYALGRAPFDGIVL